MLAGGMVRSCSLSRILIPGRQHVPKSVQVILCYANNKALSYHLTYTTKPKATDNFYIISREIVGLCLVRDNYVLGLLKSY